MIFTSLLSFLVGPESLTSNHASRSRTPSRRSRLLGECHQEPHTPKSNESIQRSPSQSSLISCSKSISSIDSFDANRIRSCIKPISVESSHSSLSHATESKASASSKSHDLPLSLHSNISRMASYKSNDLLKVSRDRRKPIPPPPPRRKLEQISCKPSLKGMNATWLCSDGTRSSRKSTQMPYNDETRGEPSLVPNSNCRRHLDLKTNEANNEFECDVDNNIKYASYFPTERQCKLLNGRSHCRQVISMPYTDEQFGDFGLYSGEVDEDGRPHGSGKMKYENGIFCEGKWVLCAHDVNVAMLWDRILSVFTSWTGKKSRDEGCHVYGMEWIDNFGMPGSYTGTVDKDKLPSGTGVMKYDVGLVAEGEWIKGALYGGSNMSACNPDHIMNQNQVG